MQGEISTFYVQQSGEYNEKVPLVYLIPDKIVNPKDNKEPNLNKLMKKLKEILRR
jgi:hypothetical protein